MKGCLTLIVVLVLICGLLSLIGEPDEYEQFIENTKSTSETPYLYLPNTNTDEYCINIDIRDSGLATYCSTDKEKIRAFSEFYHHSLGITSDYAQELMSVALNFSHLYSSTNQAADRAKITVAAKYRGKGVYEKDRKKMAKDIDGISTLASDAKLFEVSFKCMSAYKVGKQATVCSENELNNLKNKYNEVSDKNYNLQERCEKLEFDKLLPEEQQYCQWSCDCTKAVEVAKKECKIGDQNCYDRVGKQYCTGCDTYN